jgi:hypothetical protein
MNMYDEVKNDDGEIDHMKLEHIDDKINLKKSTLEEEYEARREKVMKKKFKKHKKDKYVDYEEEGDDRQLEEGSAQEEAKE